MNRKKMVALIMVLALAFTTLVGGTLAYFTDDEKATNTMVIGNVEINIDEFQKVNGQWEAFENNDFELYPVKSALGVTNRNKVVYTANVSSSEDAAYIRTIVLIEKNDLLPQDYENEGDTTAERCCVPGIHFNYFSDATATSVANGKTIHGAKVTDLDLVVEIDGEEYWAILFEEVSGLAVPYDEALFSLNGVFMDKNIESEHIAGWGEDKEVDIIVFSQGIQSTGLTYAEAMTELGEINETNLKTWLGVDGANEAVINDWGNAA